jgi:hypothetical protein
MTATQQPLRIHLRRLSHIIFYHPDLAKFRQFALDFGFSELFFCRKTASADSLTPTEVVAETPEKIHLGGQGPDAYCYVAIKGDKPRFGGAAWLAESRDELVKASQAPEAHSSGIVKLEGPGGGEIVTLTDCYGYLAHVVYGIVESTPEQPRKIHLNYPDDKVRKNEFQRFETGPASIYKIGHWGYLVPAQDFER